MKQKVMDEMVQSIKNNDFLMYLQPKINLSSMEIYGAEALVRWQHPTRGLLYPDSFIPLFEENECIMELDYYMLDKACQYIRKRMEKELPTLKISVNLSRLTISEASFYDRLIKVVDSYAIPHSYLEIEVLENALHDIDNAVITIFKKLKKSNFVISIDDFGAGYSNYNLLNELPIDIIKLDRSFIMNVDRGKRARGIISCMIDMAHAMGMKMICEGVETEENVIFLKRVGCDDVQGFFFSSALPEEQFEEFYNSYQSPNLTPVVPEKKVVYKPTEFTGVENNEYESILVHTFPGYLSLRDHNQRIIYLNDNFRNWIAEYTDVNPIGKTNVELAEIVPQNVADTFLQCHDGSMELQKGNETMQGLKKIITFRGPDNDEATSQFLDTYKYWVKFNGEPYIFTIAYDVTNLYTENMRNLHSAITDHLTGVKNRRNLQTELGLYEGHYAALLNLDHFGYVNETRGYAFGDEVLKNFVGFVKQNIPNIVSIVRNYGDEFLIIFAFNVENVEATMQDARTNYEKQNEKDELSFSYGVSKITSSFDETLTKLHKNLKKDKDR